MNNTFTELDEVMLQNIGGVGSNLFVQIIDADVEQDETQQPNIISHLSYYDFNQLSTTLNNSKINSVFSAQIYKV